MEASALGKIVAELLLAVQALTGVGASVEPPELAFLPQQELAKQVCGRPCEVYGWFPPGGTIYLDERLDLLDDTLARSILVHELVHFVQQEAGAFRAAADCAAWLERERQAYDIQLRWIAEQPDARVAFARFGRRPWKLTCPGEALNAASDWAGQSGTQ
ncbi:MAG: hypothetical protein OEM59_01775 [Rhodospirillales bacterium]|nr:hypothetical protein [Rhodospirillales bacterium]